jgi:hypothetical protein
LPRQSAKTPNTSFRELSSGSSSRPWRAILRAVEKLVREALRHQGAGSSSSASRPVTGRSSASGGKGLDAAGCITPTQHRPHARAVRRRLGRPIMPYPYARGLEASAPPEAGAGEMPLCGLACRRRAIRRATPAEATLAPDARSTRWKSSHRALTSRTARLALLCRPVGPGERSLRGLLDPARK